MDDESIPTEVISTRIRQVPVFVMRGVEPSSDDVAEVSGAGGAVPQSAPAADQDREAAFSEAPH